jgi:3-phytase
LPDGEHTFAVRASDALGNWDATPATYVWIVDTQPPSVAITAPPQGARITEDGALNVTAVADDAGTGVAEVRFYDNGVRVVTDTTAPFLYRWTVSAAKAGAHRWTAKSVDRAGNATDAAPVDVDVNLVAASAETEPVPNPGDAADDPAIYVHPADPALSAVVATDKLGGLAVYGLDGRRLHYYDDTLPNNADIRHGIDLGGTASAVVATSDRSDDSLRLYRVDPATRGLHDVGARRIAAGEDVYGVCLYRSPTTGGLYAFTTYDDGTLRQWALRPDGAGRLDAEPAREFRVPVPPAQDGQTTEACVADDDLGRLYVSAENDAIFRFEAEPDAPVAPVAVDITGAGGHLTADVEGLALYRTRTGDGYLLASSQGSDEFVVYGRQGSNPYVTTFGIGAGTGDVDKAAATDGIDVTAAPLGETFAQGLFVAQDGFNPLADGTHRQNFKLVPWQRIAGSMRVKLTSDPLWTPWPAG